LDPAADRDLLFIGTSQAVQAYDVQNNKDVFFLNVVEGVNCLVVGTCNKSLEPLLYIGSSLSIIGVDIAGKEQLWTVTGDDVIALAPVDADGDGRQELAAGTKSCDLMVFKEVMRSVLRPRTDENARYAVQCVD
jgi:Ciliary BBSome complex subunit 2, N-terminal